MRQRDHRAAGDRDALGGIGDCVDAEVEVVDRVFVVFVFRVSPAGLFIVSRAGFFFFPPAAAAAAAATAARSVAAAVAAACAQG